MAKNVVILNGANFDNQDYSYFWIAYFGSENVVFFMAFVPILAPKQQLKFRN
ncbi:MAG: hypothetical protein K2N91_00740 [Muribaculaceae bacterium]|nr:hypothetical protein [Muribaculaceae bacterium]